jgi:small GTP-binding protein
MTKRAVQKVILLGDGAVGKTSLVRKFVHNEFSENYIFTIGVNISDKEMLVKTDKDDVEVKMLIWDILGQKDFHRTQSESFIGTVGALLVADITRKETLDNLEKYWIPQYEKVAGKVPIVILANKSDLKDKAQFSEKELKEFVEKYKKATGITPSYYMTSAKTGKDVEIAFNGLATRIAKYKGM